MIHQKNTGTFIQAFRRIIARKGKVKLIQSDNGSNFLVEENDLKMVFLIMETKKLANFFKIKLLIRLNGKEIQLQPATWVASGNDKFDSQDQFSDHY